VTTTDALVTVAIPSIPPRAGTFLHRAIDSVLQQDHPVAGISVAVDVHRRGSAVTRNRALAGVVTHWTAFLDDDDTLYPEHIRSLLACAEETGADMVYPWFDVPEGWDPFPEREGQPFNPKLLDTQNTIPITVLIKTDLIRSVGGFEPKDPDHTGISLCDDWGAWVKVRDSGAKIVHLNRRTWAWRWHGGNTSGRPIW
jgi:glycosyltransferase involved in cell wall biosynthesis